MSNLTMDKLVALCKSRGFIYPGSEIYGGLANAWDYGPLGVEFKNNIKRAWWQKFVQESKYNVGLDAGILMNREVWFEIKGHGYGVKKVGFGFSGVRLRPGLEPQRRSLGATAPRAARP